MRIEVCVCGGDHLNGLATAYSRSRWRVLWEKEGDRKSLDRRCEGEDSGRLQALTYFTNFAPKGSELIDSHRAFASLPLLA
jgi:hypothetical protein